MSLMALILVDLWGGGVAYIYIYIYIYYVLCLGPTLWYWSRPVVFAQCHETGLAPSVLMLSGTCRLIHLHPFVSMWMRIYIYTKRALTGVRFSSVFGSVSYIAPSQKRKMHF